MADHELLALGLNLAILAINVGVLALSIKIYTEILKDGAQNRRAKGGA
ncbi:hypothetical protein GCM10007320_09120 [Pseudorhodoferax aquiterrae]|uniref:Uncharacterized protein n=1 Tax=Pseudorhodoferax aquiterrae TaxID=747304 RepID=A0ABQ3FWK8_9BURK|nr:hypothetical protein [Pseudorhodoferax aquiterrae]GHC72907.1 hypothetical protein GCM10007320_09120 [Pseudorhodoferax aquiterrae]